MRTISSDEVLRMQELQFDFNDLLHLKNLFAKHYPEQHAELLKDAIYVHPNDDAYYVMRNDGCAQRHYIAFVCETIVTGDGEVAHYRVVGVRFCRTLAEAIERLEDQYRIDVE